MCRRPLRTGPGSSRYPENGAKPSSIRLLSNQPTHELISRYLPSNQLSTMLIIELLTGYGPFQLHMLRSKSNMNMPTSSNMIAHNARLKTFQPLNGTSTAAGAPPAAAAAPAPGDMGPGAEP